MRKKTHVHARGSSNRIAGVSIGSNLRDHRAGISLLGAAIAAVLCNGRTLAQQAPAAGETALDEIVVTGTASKNRTVLTSSSDIVVIDEDALAIKAPRNGVEVLEMIPGMFVEATAGAVSNNYSIRGLPGGGQQFVNWMEDGLPIAYPGTGNQDELISYDINVQRVESVLGGISNVLLPNAAGASINWITRKPNFDREEAIVRASITSYADRRVDLYYSAPITKDWAFNFGGYLENNRGTRDAGFSYPTYHLKAQLEKRFDNGASIILSGKVGKQHDPYYADMPFTLVNGTVGNLQGLDGRKDNIAGPAFGNIGIPTSCLLGCYRNFSLENGIVAETQQVRLDLDIPVSDSLDVFAKAHYLKYDWDFNGIFPGSGSGNAGLDTANNYLNGGANSPIFGNLLQPGAALYPGTTFGLKDLQTGQVISSADVTTLNALNGNGLLQQTWLNRQELSGHDIASNFGARWTIDNGGLKNTLTVGAMYFKDNRFNNQSSVAHVINGVTRQSHIYDVVALNAAGNVVGTLTDHGLVSYGDWGTGITRDEFSSISGYFANEMTINDKLHIDFGARAERFKDTQSSGNNQNPVASGAFYGVTGTSGNIWDGTYNVSSASHGKVAHSLGVNYTFSNNLAVFGQYGFGFQMNGGGNQDGSRPTSVVLYEAGVRYNAHGVSGSIGAFRTQLKNQSNGCFDPINPTLSCNINYDVVSKGIEYDLTFLPLHSIGINSWEMGAHGALQKPSVSSAKVFLFDNGVLQSLTNFTNFNGNVNPRTPKTLFSMDQAYVFPKSLGRAYVRYFYQGSFYNDIGNGVKIPGYGTWAAGIIWNVTPKLNVNFSVQNIGNTIGLTEGNPRQGLTQQVVNGSFYARSIAGRNEMLMIQYTF